ncbi:MAG TPA: isoprenylcysteine carboxylmethyltransferase family protein, partial [Candidatus Kapabacteria bacterium]|nr:isoprenylcysteine carboxylmethyltransferase family protein [Candidatus Kapabacteria bacterium]
RAPASAGATMMDADKIKADTLVLIQILTAGIVLYLGLQRTVGLFIILIVVCGLGIMLISVLTMKLSNFRVSPIPKTDARLVTSGIYKYIRHPIYTGLLVAVLGFAINAENAIAYILWIILAADLITKIRFEEALLAKQFTEYAEYKKRTKRLVPFVW